MQKMVKPKIGFKVWNIFYEGPNKINLNVMEITSKDKNFGFRKKDLGKIKKKLKGKYLSIHTQTKRVFTEKNNTLRDLEIATLRVEILASAYLNCKELIVHLKEDKLTENEVKTFSEILEFSRKKNVEILYEPNGNFNGRNFLYNLSKFPKLNVNLDLCHLAMAVQNRSLGMDLNDFLDKVKDRVVYVHASGYDDEEGHLPLHKGKLDWKAVLNKLNLSRIRKIIIELHNFEEFDKTRKQIEDYLKS